MDYDPNDSNPNNTVSDQAKETLASSEDNYNASSENDSEAPDGRGLIDSLINELQQGNVSDQQIEILRSELAVQHPNSMEVRLRYIQSRMEEFSAYIEGLEEIIDVHGSATEFIDEIHEEISDLHTNFDELRTQIETSQEDQEEIVAELDQLASDLSMIEDRVEVGFENTRKELASIQENHVNDIQEVTSEVDALKEEHAELNSELLTAYQELRSDFDELKEEVKLNTEQRKRLTDVLRET